MITKKFFKVLSIWMIMTWMIVPVILADESKEEKNKDQAIERQTFFLLPFGRDFTSLFSILPGVASEPLLGGLSIHGASGAENRFFVDGAETTNLINGTSAQQVNLDFAESVSYKTFGFEASDDASMGGTIQVITRSGGNQFHGGITGYFTSNWLTGTPREYLALDVDDSSKTAYYSYEEWIGVEKWHRIEPGINLSGPIVKDKLWFYGSFMPNFYKLDRICEFKLQGYKVDPEKTSRKETHMNYLIKLTAQPSNNIRLGVSFVNNHLLFQGIPKINISSWTRSSRFYWGRAYEATEEHITQTKFFLPNFSISGYADIILTPNFSVNLHGSYFFSNEYEKRIAKPKSGYYFGAEQPYGYSPTTNEKWAAEYAAMGHSDKVCPATPNRNRPGISSGTQKNIKERITGNIDLFYHFSLAGKHAIRSGIQLTTREEDVASYPYPTTIYFAWDMDLDLYGTRYGRGKYGWVAVRGNEWAPFGNIYDVKMDQWSIYLQDSWTIGDRLTLNLGIRTESEYIPSYSDVPELMDIKPITFSFSDKISPRLGFIYDVKGDGNLKIFGHFGIYQDHMKLYMAASDFGGFKWYSAYYPLDTLLYWEMDGEMNGMEPWAVVNHRIPDFDMVDPSLKPMTQREISLGFQKFLSDNLILSGQVINRSLLQAIEDVELVLPADNKWGSKRYYFYSNPGSDFINQKYQEARDTGIIEPDTPDLPKAKREYWGVTLNLEKRLADNWMGGVSVTWSSLRGNYTGLVSSDENGRNAPYGTRSFDNWHLLYTKDLELIDSPLPTDRPIVVKAYGSYVFLFDLTVGMVVNAMSGTPVTEEWNVDSTGYFPFNRGNMGRTPFLFLADLLISQDIKIGKVTLNLNATIQNLLNAKTVIGIHNEKTRWGISPTDREKIDNSWTFESEGGVVDPRFGMDNNFVPPIQVRLGAKILF